MQPLCSAFILLTSVALATNSSVQEDTEAARCSALRVQCVKDSSARNSTAMRDSCQKCYHTCFPLVRKKHDEPFDNWNQCLTLCIDHDCIGNDTANGVPVTVDFQCKVYGRWCWTDFEGNQENDLVNKSCGTCAKVCDFASVRRDRGYCENRCMKRGFACASNNSTTITSPTPKPKPKDRNATSQSNGNVKTWEWLGPVLGAVATIIGAVITVVWVRDFRHTRPAAPDTIDPDPSPLPPIEQGYDEGWPVPYGSTGVAELFEQGVQRPSSGLSNFFSRRRWLPA